MASLEGIIQDGELEFEIRNADRPTVCGICGENHSPKECNILKITNQILDRVIPSKARLTLPDALKISKLADGTHNVYARQLIERGTQFGPFQAKKLFTLHPSIDFSLKIFTDGDEDLSEYFLDTSDENECSWMMFVAPASNFEEQNTICYQEGEHLYYGTIRDVQPGEPLKVWYSPHYAAKMKKEILNMNNSQEIVIETSTKDVESILKKKSNISPRDSWSCKFCGKVEKELSVFALHLLDHYRAQMKRHMKKHLRSVHINNLQQTVEIKKETQVVVPKVEETECREATSVGGPLLLNDIIPDSLDNSSLFLPQTDMSQFDLGSIENQNMMLENDNLNLNTDNILTENVKGLDSFNFDLNVPESEQLICDVCLKSFVKLRSLIQHLDIHTGKFWCQSCDRVFARKENLVHHPCNSFYKVKCPLCDTIFFQKKYLTRHIKVYHKREYTCDLCQKYFDSKKRLETHNCPKVPLNKKEKFPCDLCPKVFFKKWNLEEHVARHKRIKKDVPYICAVCNIILGSRKSYLQHVKLHDGQFFPCDVCEKQFKRQDSLLVHQKQVHSNEVVEETCNVCQKKVKSKKILKIHMETHRDDKPYKCLRCQASFKQRTNLTKHAKKHKAFEVNVDSLFQDNIEVYHCPKCKRNMKLKSSLQRHMRVFHPEDQVPVEAMKPRMGRLTTKKLPDGYKFKDANIDAESNESMMDLKQTIENMNFNTDDVNCENNDINIEIDKILNNADNIGSFFDESKSCDGIVESLMNIAAKENQLSSVGNQYVAKEVCLSMPDLTENDTEIKLEIVKVYDI